MFSAILILILALTATDTIVAQDRDVDHFMLEMSDGTQLATDVYYPSDGAGSWPVLLYRTPYGINTDNISSWTSNHFVTVCQDIRGRFASEGVFNFFREDGWGPENQDGLETVEWILQHDWCNGKIGTMGTSARAVTQYQLAGALPPNLFCQHMGVGPSDMYAHAVFQGGAFRERLMVGWLNLNGCPYLLDSLAAHPNDDDWWTWLDSGTRDSLITIPGYHWGGWYDLFLDSQISRFKGLQEGGAPGARGNQKLLLGAWTHGWDTGALQYPGNNTLELGEAQIGSLVEWNAYWLEDEPSGIMDLPPIAYYMMGDVNDPYAPGNEWRTAEVWPPPAEEQVWYLHGDALLARTLPEGAATCSLSYNFDPYDPVPTLGGANRFGLRGPYDQRSVESRPDVLLYTSPLLDEPVEIVGPVRVILYGSSDCLDTDFTAKLTDVYPDGRSMLVCDGILRARHRISMSSEDFLTPGEIYAFEISLGETALAFAAGHQIRLAVSSSNFDRFAVNPNTGEPFALSYDEMQVAHNTVYQEAGARSHLILRVAGGVAGAEEIADVSELRLITVSPAPVGREATIRFDLGRGQRVALDIYDPSGRRVASLADRVFAPGGHSVVWDRRDCRDRRAESGVYWLQLSGETSSRSVRIVLLDE